MHLCDMHLCDIRLCFDVGNTNIVIGVFKGKELKGKYRFSTSSAMTENEFQERAEGFIASLSIKKEEIEGIIIGSVVPARDGIIREAVITAFGKKPIIVKVGKETGIGISIENPDELGADLLAAAARAAEKYGSGILVVDIGTAMTFTYIDKDFKLAGGSIMPGIKTAFSGLFQKAAKLAETPLEDTEELLGKNTEACIKSGMIFGWTAMVEGMIGRYGKEYDIKKTIITGGEAPLLIKHIDSDLNIVYDEDLVLEGLDLLYRKNQNKN